MFLIRLGFPDCMDLGLRGLSGFGWLRSKGLVCKRVRRGFITNAIYRCFMPYSDYMI